MKYRISNSLAFLFGMGFILIPLSIRPETANSTQDQSQAIKDFLQRASAFQIFQKIDSIKIKVFSNNSFIRNGIPQESLKEWQDLTEVANQFAEEEAKKDPKYNKYKIYSYSTYLAFNNIKKIINNLHQKYASLYIKDADEGRKPILQMKYRLRSSALKELQVIITLLKEQSDKMHEVSDATFAVLLKGAQTPKVWSAKLYDKKGNIKDADEVMFGYKKFLKNYVKEKDFGVFLKANGIIDPRSAEKTINSLEQIAFIMKEKLRSSADKERQENLRLTQEIIVKINDKFPGIMSALQLNIFSLSQDKPSMILFAESSALESVLNQLEREVNELLAADAAKRTKQ